jgi:hypothetical protein
MGDPTATPSDSMARKLKRTAASASAPPLAQPSGAATVNLFGPTDQRKITRKMIAESVFTLSDGTKLRVKPLIGDVRRALDQYNAEGQPLYFLSLGLTISTDAPKSLLRPPSEDGAKSKKVKSTKSKRVKGAKP